MAAQVISLMSRTRPAASASRDWTQREIAEFYRVESALIQAGLELESERGLSDEGDPWFAFCRVDTGEVFIHFARENGRYVVDGGPFGAAARGNDFSELVRELIARHPLATTRRSGSNVFLHPAALLIALVGACFFHSGQAKAAETAEGHAARAADAHRRTAAAGIILAAVEGAPTTSVTLDAAQTAAILAGVLIGLQTTVSQAATSPTAGPVVALSAPASPLGPIAPTVSSHNNSFSTVEHSLFALAVDARTILSVVAVLHDVIRMEGAAAQVGSADGVGVTGLRAAALPSTAIPAPEASAPSNDRPLVVVHLSGGDLPQVEALAVIESTGVLRLLADSHLTHLDQLPALLADLISRGEHVDVTVLAAPAQDLGDLATLPQNSHTSQSELGPAGAHGSPSDPASDGAGSSAPHQTDPPDASLPPPAPSPIPLPTPTPDPPVSHDPPPAAPPGPTPAELAAKVDIAVLKFTALVGGHPGVIMAGHEIVLYDPQIYSADFKAQPLDSITYTFDDGSSVSLVGTLAELHDLHGLH